MSCTCVFFHAHPDDEALLTAGTMARLAAEGHRVVLVVATAGERGLSDVPATGGRLGELRLAELDASAEALGCARVLWLGYADSGLDGAVPLVAGRPVPFARADVEQAAGRLAGELRAERADLLTVYDPTGGYGHPDHVTVHRVGVRAAELAGTRLVLEATVHRGLLLGALRLLALLRLLPPGFDHAGYRRCYVPGAEITHRVDVRAQAPRKRASIAAHASQHTGGDTQRTLAGLLRLPQPLFRRALGTEWYVQRGLPAGTRLRHPLERPAAVPESAR